MNDLKFAIRQLLKSPGFTAVAVLTLALGIGANTAIFTVINTLVLRVLPVTDPAELVQVFVAGTSSRDYSFSYPMYERLREAGGSLSGLFAAGGVSQGRMTTSGIGARGSELVRSQAVTGNFFDVLGVGPFLGRVFSVADDQPGRPAPVVVLNYGFWQRRFGADLAVVGKTFTFNDVPVTVAGVTPPGFFGFQPGENPDLWWPIQLSGQVQQIPLAQALGEGNDWLRLLGRVRPGSGVHQAEAELAVAFERYRAERAAVVTPKLTAPERERIQQDRLKVQPAGNGWTRLRERFDQPLTILTAIVGLVLLIACANVANLMLARTATRAREFSIRSALGARRGQLIRQLLTESVLLAATGGLLGLLVAHWGAHLLLSFAGVQPDPVSFDLAPDARVLCFTTVLSLATGVVFGLAPAFRSSRPDLAVPLKGSGASIAGSRPILQQSLVVAQVAVSLILLVGAGLFVRTLQKLRGLDMGFSCESVVLFQVGFSERVDRTRRARVYKALLARLAETRGVRAASLTRITPLTENTWGQRLAIEDYTPGPEEVVLCRGMTVSDRYFETMGTPLLSGHDFGPQNERLAPSASTNAIGVAIINETFAKKYFGTASALGRRFNFFASPDRKFEIVGVARDAKYRSLREPAPPTFYTFCFEDLRDWDMTFAVRLPGTRTAATDAIRRAVRETDPLLDLREVRTLTDVVNASVQRERIIASLGGFFSLTALALACLGLYGTLSFVVAQRTHEIGVRLALGAQRGNLLSLVIGSGLKLTLIGAAIGFAGALAVTRLVSGLLFGVSSMDSLTFAAVTALLVMVALAACWLPARRATAIDPMEALRYE